MSFYETWKQPQVAAGLRINLDQLFKTASVR